MLAFTQLWISFPLPFAAEDVESEALAALILNKIRAGIKIAAVKAPGFGDNRKANLQDIADLTGGTVISEDIGLKLEKATLENLGRCRKATITKDDTLLLGGYGTKEAIAERCQMIREMIEQVRALMGRATVIDSLSCFWEWLFVDRVCLSRLCDLVTDQVGVREGEAAGAPRQAVGRCGDPEGVFRRGRGRPLGVFALVAVAHACAYPPPPLLAQIGGASEIEVGEKKDRVTDALNATRAAVAEGIVPGGGSILLHGSKTLDALMEAQKSQVQRFAEVVHPPPSRRRLLHFTCESVLPSHTHWHSHCHLHECACCLPRLPSLFH